VTKAASTFRGRFDLLRQAQKRRRGVPLYTLYVNRPIGRAIAAASPSWATPNHLTIIGAVLTYAALFWLMFFATVGPAAVLVGVGLVVGFFFDSADGQLARLRAAGSVSGEWLDHLLDSGRIVLLHVATLWFLVRNDIVAAELAVVVCTAFMLAATMVFFGATLFEKLDAASQPVGAEAVEPPKPSTLRSAVMLPVDYGVTCVVFLLVPWPTLFFGVYCLLAVAKVGSTSVFLRKWYLSLRRIDRQRWHAGVPGDGDAR
jgi:phosphatidylglycerophosphate synthase